MKLIRPTLIFAALIVATLVFAACGSDSEPTPTTESASATSTPTAVVTLAPGEPTPTPSRDMEAYFSGKTIKVVVGFAPGGGYDVFGRLFAKYAPKHFPGSPRFVVQNVDGAGGERVFKTIDGKTDGLSVAVAHPRFFKRELLGADVPYLDLETINFLGTPSAVSTTSAYYVFKDFATSWQDALDKGLAMTDGQTAVGDTGGIGIAFIELMGGPARQIPGYGGTSEIAAAMDRGEITGSSRGNYDNGARLFPEWVENQRIVPLFTWGADPADDPAFLEYMVTLGTEVPPTMYEALAMAGIEVSDGQKTVFDLTQGVNDQLSRTFALPAGIPDDIYAFWTKAFEEVLADPEFIAAAAVANYPVAFGSPEAIRHTISEVTSALSGQPELSKLFADLAGVE